MTAHDYFRIYDVVNKEAAGEVPHLRIVAVSVRDLERRVSVTNQFDNRTSLEIGRSVPLAVPSGVRDWKPA